MNRDDGGYRLSQTWDNLLIMPHGGRKADVNQQLLVVTFQ